MGADPGHVSRYPLACVHPAVHHQACGLKACSCRFMPQACQGRGDLPVEQVCLRSGSALLHSVMSHCGGVQDYRKVMDTTAVAVGSAFFTLAAYA